MSHYMKFGVVLLLLSPCYLLSGESPRKQQPQLLQDNTFSITVDAARQGGDLLEIWWPGIAIEGIGADFSLIGYASDGTLDMWESEVGFERGLFHIQLEQWTYEVPGSSLEDRAQYMSDIQAAGGDLLVRLLGTPESMVDTTSLPYNYWGYPPDDLAAWQDFIYEELKYLVVEGAVMNNPLLFGDSKDHFSRGLGDDILFSFWYGIWGPEGWQFKGTAEEFYEIWNATYQASRRLEEDYGVDIKLGGFGITHDEEGMWGEGGFVDNLIAYSSDPNSDSNNEDRIPIDWIDYQFRHPDPFAISQPYPWEDYRGEIQSYLETHGYDPNTPIMANAWHGTRRVFDTLDSLSAKTLYTAEAQCEIDAALNPARLYDMELAGQRQQYREAIQDFSTVGFPLFQPSGSGGIGIATFGLESEGFLGLKKATWNTFRMINMLGDTRLNCTSSGMSFLDRQATVNAIATRNDEDQSIQILIWSYISPFRYISNNDPVNLVGYDELYSLVSEEIGSDSFYVNVSVDNIGYDKMRITRYLVDKTHSNSFAYANEICWALGLDDCPGDFPYEQTYTIAEINQWAPDNNPYHVSVDLEKVEEYLQSGEPQFEKDLPMLPYSATLIVIQTDGPTSAGDDPNPTSGIRYPSPLVLDQNAPNPFNPSTSITFRVAEQGSDQNQSDLPVQKSPVSLRIYDIRGRLVKEILNEGLEQGEYEVTWDGRDSRDQTVPSGIYFYRISSGDFQVSKKMTLLK